MRRQSSILVTALVTTVAGGVLLGGCGSSTGDDHVGGDAGSSIPPTSSTPTTSDPASPSPAPTHTSSSTAPQLPTCDSVWVDGQQLALGYHGCLDGATTVRAQRQPCEMGKPLVTYRNRFWASAGGPVHEVAATLAKDQGWHRALIQCGG